jgi:hypothetical protein
MADKANKMAHTASGSLRTAICPSLAMGKLAAEIERTANI